MDIYEEVTVAILFIGFSGLLLVLFRKLLENRKRKVVNDTSGSRSGHYWSPINIEDHGYFCACCKQNIRTTGYECDYCTLKVDKVECIKQISVSILCKVNFIRKSVEIDPSTSMKHHWIPRNLEEDKFCFVCEELCGGGVGLQDFRCSWCCQVVHKQCQKSVGEGCDLGELANFVISPLCVTSRKSSNRAQKYPVIDEIVLPPNAEKWCPIIAIVNPKSGSGLGREVLRKFRSCLHPCQVIDVTKSNVKCALSWIDSHPEIKPRILIAGGDGTISLVLNDIDQLRVSPPVAILPLGTGNDLSRVLGWGAECNGAIDVVQLLHDVFNGRPRSLDRWTVQVNNNRKLGVRFFNKTLSMTNYVSIGVDACVTLGMQTTRDSIPRALSSRLLNKLLFFTYGTKDVFERACNGLNNNIEVFLDESVQPLNLPDVEGLVFLNIPSWGAGVQPWSSAPEEFPQAIDDGLLEVFGVTSSFHIAQLQVGLSTPLHLGQARKVTLKVKNGPLPMQSDGEAWMQNAAVITISHKTTATVLERSCSNIEGFF